jgi:ABC-type polysaccharide/polyol phosphate transport system ATPase subunit
MTAAPAIVVEGVVKDFRRPQEQMHTLKERALHPFRRSDFDRFRAVDDVSFQVEEGEFFGIVGRNGSGKSTLLKLIAGIYRTTAGEIWTRGRMSTFIELGVGFNPDLAARDNVILNAIMLGLTPADARRRYEQVIDFAELREYDTVKLKNYSSGMHVRLAFSVMIQVDADVLLIDEVLAVGDASFQQKCFDEFHRLRDEHKTMVLVTHDMGAVRRFCDRALLMERGVVVREGDPILVGEHYLDLNFRNEHPAAAAQADADRAAQPTRFGDGSAEFIQLWIEDAAGEPLVHAPQGDDLVLRSTVRFDADIEDPVVSILIEDADHRPVFATSSVWTQQRTGRFAAGEAGHLRLQLPTALAPGRYFVTPWVSRPGAGTDVLDKRPQMISFLVTGTRETGGIVDLEHDLSFERIPVPVT